MSTLAQAVYLKDYQASDYLVESVLLSFELEPDDTRVTNEMCFYRSSSVDQATPLVLHGEGQRLESVSLNGQLLSEEAYVCTAETLTIFEVPERFTLTVISHCQPSHNTALEGLYVSNAKFCTQCEPHGFRKITYYLDRPDVMAVFTTKIIADPKRYPVLLSNGNLLSEERLPDGRKVVVWQDPFKKPCYLFALVAGDLVYQEDYFVTQSQRRVTLRIYVEPGNLDKTQHAMLSLQQAMRWDEEQFGREYDLDIFMIVAVSDFNMGAMENKGLNIFNAKYILANAEVATDQDYEGITVVVGHEYFHNWTGNRITCRDWFQLSLKEGLTVFRDQEFCADMTSRVVTRVDDVRLLKNHQFQEDAGPLAHPVRPASYIEMNNFYTATVYNKGAEVVRMLKTIEGAAGFRAGMDRYFELYDGQAVTCDDFVAAHSQATGQDYQQFMRWYSQAGTPMVTVRDRYDTALKVYEITFSQATPASADGSTKEAFVIPVRLGLFSSRGKNFALDEDGNVEKVILLTETEQTLVFHDIPSSPIPSLFRGFSAPVNYQYSYTLAQLLAQLRYDVDPYNRFAASQQIIFQLAQVHQWTDLEAWLPALAYVLSDTSIDDALKARILTVPSEKEFAQQQTVIDVHWVIHNQHLFSNTLAQGLHEDLQRCYEALQERQPVYQFSAEQTGARALMASCLRYLHLANPQVATPLCRQQYFNADNMTDRFHALAILVHQGEEEHFEPLLADFYQRYQDQALVIEKWFSLQATIPHKHTLQRVMALLEHPDFDMKNPNKVRSVIGAFASQNFVGFHLEDGSAYEFLAQKIIELNAINPLIAARLVEPLSHWRRYPDTLAVHQRSALQSILLTENLSKDVYEVVSKCLSH